MRRCSRCDSRRAFVSSDRFRVNAHKQRLDVWLIYRCSSCEQTWNLPVHERLSPAAIGAADLARFHDNDREWCWRVSFDSARFARLGVEVDFETDYRVARGAVGADTIQLRLERPCRVRLDRLLASELGISRSAVRECVVGVNRRELRRPIKHGQELVVRPF